MNDTHFNSSFGEFELHRLPRRKKELLRAWDAADEYLLQTLSQQATTIGRPLICNDNFGALAVVLNQMHPVSWSDSWLTHQATRENLKINQLDESSVEYLPSTVPPSGAHQLFLIKIPKNLGLLEHQLIQLRPHLNKNAKLLLAGMVKNMPSSVWQLLEKIIGPTETSLAQKKARIVTAVLDPRLNENPSPYPVSWSLENSQLKLTNHANVFSRDKLDVGTRLMLQHLPATKGSVGIIDLGCGNGVLGLVSAQRNPESNVCFVDESYMAIESARNNMDQLHKRTGSVRFVIGDGLNTFESDSHDLVLCNPPFHQQQALADTVALSMFAESARVLKVDGALWVIGNRHLQYHNKLRTWFNNIELVASNRKFVLLKATQKKARH